jgi:hypothetical protein
LLAGNKERQNGKGKNGKTERARQRVEGKGQNGKVTEEPKTG